MLDAVVVVVLVVVVVVVGVVVAAAANHRLQVLLEPDSFLASLAILSEQ
jgi:hypothetical protein